MIMRETSIEYTEFKTELIKRMNAFQAIHYIPEVSGLNTHTEMLLQDHSYDTITFYYRHMSPVTYDIELLYTYYQSLVPDFQDNAMIRFMEDMVQMAKHRTVVPAQYPANELDPGRPFADLSVTQQKFLLQCYRKQNLQQSITSIIEELKQATNGDPNITFADIINLMKERIDLSEEEHPFHNTFEDLVFDFYQDHIEWYTTIFEPVKEQSMSTEDEYVRT